MQPAHVEQVETRPVRVKQPRQPAQTSAAAISTIRLLDRLFTYLRTLHLLFNRLYDSIVGRDGSIFRSIGVTVWEVSDTV